MYNARVGQLFYARHRGLWGVWKMVERDSADFVKDFVSKEEARSFVFESNGWNKNN